MSQSTMHPRIAELARELFPITKNPPAQPTKQDYDKLQTIRGRIKRLPDEAGISLSESDETDRQYLYVVSTREANRQEEFWEKNGKWAS